MLEGVKKSDDYTYVDRDIIITAAKNITAGHLSKFKAKKMWEVLKDAQNPQQVLAVVKDFKNDWQEIESTTVVEGKNEIILSKCFYGGE
jgi:uridine kinase